MSGFWQDLRFGIRMLLKSRGFTAVAGLSLGLGIGGNTTIYSVINTLRYQPMPFRDPERLTVIDEANPAKGISGRTPTFATVTAIRQQAQSFEKVGLFSGPSGVTLSSDGGTADRVLSQRVDGELFATLGVEPLLGRTLVPSDAVWGQASVILLSYDTWQTRFGGDTEIVGKTLWVEGRDRTVVGVMPQGFWISPWGGNVAYWECNELGPMPASRWMTKIGRLKAGIEPEQAAAETTPLIQRTEESLGNDPAGWNARVEPLQQAFFGQIERGLLFFLGSVGFVLLIACANVANLLLARGADRRKELALRSSLGAGRLRLIRQLLIEALLLAIGGGVLGALLSVWGNELFILWAPNWFPRTEEIGIDARVLAFTAALSLLTALVFGLLPALRVSKVNSNETLKEGGRGIGPRWSGRSRKLLLACEVALAMALLLGAGMMIQSFLKEMHADTGYRVEGLLRAEILLAGPKYYLDTEEPKPVTPQVADFYRQVLEHVRALPGVESAGIISRLLPVQGWHPQPFTIVGRPDPPPW